MKKFFAYITVVGIFATALFGNVSTVQAEVEFKETGKIWLVGDSIISDHNDEDNFRDNKVPITGWGNVLQNYVSKDVKVENKARSGRSSQSYTREMDYREVLAGLQPGDYLYVQFGHNDEKADNKGLYTEPTGDSNTEGSFKWYLKTYYLEPAMEQGARVILASNVVRYTFENGEQGVQTNEPYAVAMKELAEEYKDKNVYFIDGFQITKELYEELGEEGAKKMHAVLKQDPDTEMDKTHYGPYGAMHMAGVFAQELKALGLECFQDIKAAKTMDKSAAEKARGSVGKFAWR